MIGNNVNQRYQVPMQAMSQAQIRDAINASQASMEGLPVNQEEVKKKVQENYVVKRISEMSGVSESDVKATALIAVPTWYGLAQSMDYFAKGCRGDYTDTIQYKMNKFGDDVVGGYRNSGFAKSGFGKWLNNSFHSSTKFINDKIVNNSSVLRSIRDTPSKPKLGMVKAQAKGMEGQLLLDYPQIAENFVKPLEHAKDLDGYGASKSFIDSIKSKIKANPKDKIKIMQEAEFELLAKYADGKKISDFKGLLDTDKIKLLENMKAKAFGYADADTMKKLIKDASDNSDEILRACQKADKKMFSKIWSGADNIFGKIQGHLFGRNVYASETANKLIGSGAGNVKHHKTWLGKAVPNVTNIATEGLTNRVAGGKMVAMMQAVFMAYAFLKTYQAEGVGEKVRTFAERMVEMVAMFAGIPLSIMAMHKLGGIQYAGMSGDFAKNAMKNINTKLKGSTDEIKAAKKMVAEFQDLCNKGTKPHEAYRQILDKFNNVSKNAGWSKAQHTGGQKALKYIRKGDTKNLNIITRTLKKGAEVLTVGLERVRPYTKTAVGSSFWSKTKEFFKHPRHALKYASGYPMRFITAMLVIAPMISNPLIKLTHKIFGKPKESVLDEPKEEDTEAQTQQMEEMQNVPPVVNPQAVAQMDDVTKAMLIEKYKKLQAQTTASNPIEQPVQSEVASTSPQIQAPKRTYVPSPYSTIAPDPELTRSYVPNPTGVQAQNNEDPTAANLAMQRSEMAEKNAMEMLKMG